MVKYWPINPNICSLKRTPAVTEEWTLSGTAQSVCKQWDSGRIDLADVKPSCSYPAPECHSPTIMAFHRLFLRSPWKTLLIPVSHLSGRLSYFGETASRTNISVWGEKQCGRQGTGRNRFCCWKKTWSPFYHKVSVLIGRMLWINNTRELTTFHLLLNKDMQQNIDHWKRLSLASCEVSCLVPLGSVFL